MKTLNNKSIALIASVIVLSAGFSSCTDEPEMVTTTVHADTAGVGSPADKPCGEKDALNTVNGTTHSEPSDSITVSWSGDMGVAYVTVNGANVPTSGSIQLAVGSDFTISAEARGGFVFTSPYYGNFTVTADVEGGVINIPITTRVCNF